MNVQSDEKGSKANRNPDGTYVKGHEIPGPGHPVLTVEEKIAKKAAKEIILEYKEKLAAALPKIEPVLIEKAIAGDISFIKELHDRAMGKAEQPGSLDLTSKGEKIEGLALTKAQKVAEKYEDELKQNL